MQNVEFKAELRDLPLARSLCLRIKATPIETLEQTDTYFKLADGRLKKRETVGHPTEYIFYHRDNSSRPRLSRFTIYSEQEAKTHFGAVELPPWLVVRKTRELYMHMGTRIHLDTVHNLGNYIEFEALVSPNQNLAKCYESVNLLRQAFMPVTGEPMSVSYCDLMAQEEPGIEPAAGPPV